MDLTEILNLDNIKDSDTDLPKKPETRITATPPVGFKLFIDQTDSDCEVSVTQGKMLRTRSPTVIG